MYRGKKNTYINLNFQAKTYIDLYDIPHIFYRRIIHTHCLRTPTGYIVIPRQTVSLYHNS